MQHIPWKESQFSNCHCLLHGGQFLKFWSSVWLPRQVIKWIKYSNTPADWFCCCLQTQTHLIYFVSKLHFLPSKTFSSQLSTIEYAGRHIQHHLNLSGAGSSTLLSPVTTMTRMPADLQVAMAFLTSSLGGSNIPTYQSTDKVMWAIIHKTDFQCKPIIQLQRVYLATETKQKPQYIWRSLNCSWINVPTYFQNVYKFILNQVESNTNPTKVRLDSSSRATVCCPMGIGFKARARHLKVSFCP